MPLNVLHVRASTGFGGAENIIISICQNLDSRRFQASILATFPDRFESSFLSATATQLGIPCHTLKYSRRFSLKSIRFFLRYIDEHKIDIVHTHGYRENILACFAVYFKNVATVSTTHGWITDPLRKQIDLWALKPLHRILAVSPTIQRQLLAAGIKKHKVVLLVNAVDVNQFYKRKVDDGLRKKFGIYDGDFVVGTAARLSPEKGIDDLIRAAQYVVAQCPQAKFLIVGDGPMQEALKKLTADLNLYNVVRFAGYQDDMATIYNLMDLYASPSFQEEMPRSILEAAASERPIVATDVGGVSQIIKHGETGVLVPAKQPQKIAEEIIKLIQNPKMGEHYGSKARQWVGQKFSETEALRNMEKIYKEVFDEVKRKKN